MSVNLVVMAKDLFAHEVVQKVAYSLNENETRVSKAFEIITPIIFSFLSDKVNTSKGLQYILQTAAQQSSVGFSNHLSSISNPESGQDWIIGASSMVQEIFGNKADNIIQLVSNIAGIKTSSSSTLLSIALPSIIEFLGQYISSRHLCAGDVSTLLISQSGHINSALPEGLNLRNLFSPTLLHHFQSINASTRQQPIHNKSLSFLKPIVTLALLGIMTLIVYKSCTKNPILKAIEEDQNSEVALTVDSTELKEKYASEENEFIDIEFHGQTIKGYRNGMEVKILQYLNSGKYTTSYEDELKKTWYELDQVRFKAGSATKLEAGSESQLRNIITILRIYPEAKIKIGAYTDATGNAVVNKKLSQQRAEYILLWLIKKGMGDQVVNAEGYGSDYATAPSTASDIERSPDRKIALRFTKSSSGTK